MLNGISLLLATAVAASGRGKLRWSIVATLSAFALGIFQAEQTVSSMLHWLGVLFLVLAIGPVFLNPVAAYLRSTAWKYSINGIAALTVAFVLWYLCRLPRYGGTYFLAFMNHSMLLGPIAGIGVVIALARTMHRWSWTWTTLALFGFIPLLASGSRVAALATGVAGCFLFLRRKPLIGAICLIILSCLIYGFLKYGEKYQTGDSFANALSKKGTGNSRADLWESRIDEFKSSPLIGIGVAMGSGAGASVEKDDMIRIEPGSSYLALLSMTGAIGVIAFIAALAPILYRFIQNKRVNCINKDILSVVGIYLAVHGFAEGWILGFGHPLCFLFWLWLGNVSDMVLIPFKASAPTRLRKCQVTNNRNKVMGNSLQSASRLKMKLLVAHIDS
jgi:hypothetical protein